MLTYPVRIQPDGDGFLAEFRDIPEALTGAATKEEILELSKDALITAMEFYFEDNRFVPMPTAPEDQEELIELPYSLSVKVLLLNEMLKQKVKPVELARKLHIKRQDVSRYTDLYHSTKIDNLADAFKVLGKRLEINVS
jgi:antitoxin HicB